MLTDASIEIIVTSIVLSILCILIVALRLSARKVKSQDYYVDDYLIVAALIVIICNRVAFICGATVGGIGVHMKDLKMEAIMTFLKFTFTLQFTYIVEMTLIKLSVLLLYKRIFVTPKIRQSN